MYIISFPLRCKKEKIGTYIIVWMLGGWNKGRLPRLYFSNIGSLSLFRQDGRAILDSIDLNSTERRHLDHSLSASQNSPIQFSIDCRSNSLHFLLCAYM